jgi:hypothetical protein
VHPDRRLPTDPEARSAQREERILDAALWVVGAIPLAIALQRGGRLGVEATLGLGMALAGLAALAASARAARGR